MDKAKLINKVMELKKLKRDLEDLAKDLKIGDIKNDKIYIAILSYEKALADVLKEG